MKPHKRTAITCAIFATGVVMLVWGGRGYARNVPLPVDVDGDGIRFCVPTIGEIAEDIGVWVAVGKLCYLGIAGAGAIIIAGSALSLLATKKTA